MKEKINNIRAFGFVEQLVEMLHRLPLWGIRPPTKSAFLFTSSAIAFVGLCICSKCFLSAHQIHLKEAFRAEQCPHFFLFPLRLSLRLQREQYKLTCKTDSPLPPPAGVARLFSLSSVQNGGRRDSSLLPYTPQYEKERVEEGVRGGAPCIDIHHSFIALGIETSCDDTAIAIVKRLLRQVQAGLEFERDGSILGECVVSQPFLVEKFGGVHPAEAQKAHLHAIEMAIQTTLKKAGLPSIASIDVIAMAIGPGLGLCLRVGYETAISLCKNFMKPFMAIHHLEAHCLSPRLCSQRNLTLSDIYERKHLWEATDIESLCAFPYLTLLVSGGHSQLILVNDIANYTLLGTTLDDAIGEAFDKAARYLHLPVGFGGGPAIEQAAQKGNYTHFHLPMPMKSSKTLDFSFSGIKSSFKRVVEQKKHHPTGADRLKGRIVSEATVHDLAATFQHEVVEHLITRVEKAMNLCDSLLGISTLAVK
ncbi:glycoprotease family protein [Cardiosporidium cionae]|uniref:N(6)-L-threonylcarbamoyladenine synthase n=1 Tax=Cardiosporidium cionae TaxID=476202 RepID=A0ABQ7JAR6_9APIC|nr:glycoprotease family protein [Cardiosporidium cionae]|eukprot:KAF8821043.1 glycoprotease family protein [Cardiosporidium cionae]